MTECVVAEKKRVVEWINLPDESLDLTEREDGEHGFMQLSAMP